MQTSKYLHIPDVITVHLGNPDFEAPNITVPFILYIKNTVCCETHPSWPENALIANIYAIISFALNRFYTRWYRSGDRFFDITNDIRYDPAFRIGQSIFKNIGNLVDGLFNDYVIRQGSAVPLFGEFCNGTGVMCDGLSQAGAIRLAEQGASVYEILAHYFGEDISIIQNAPLEAGVEPFAGTPLMRGAAGENILAIKHQLNRIGENFAAIPRISVINTSFDRQAEIAVRAFQSIFFLPINGVIDKATWYKLKLLHMAIERHGRLMKEALTSDRQVMAFSGDLAYGKKGAMVLSVQYYLAIVAYFNPFLNVVPIDGTFGAATVNAVEQFQRFYGLPVTGIVCEPTFNKLTGLYSRVLVSSVGNQPAQKAVPFPGYVLSEGANSDEVALLKTYLYSIGVENDGIPLAPITQYYDFQMRESILAVQRLYGLTPDGQVNMTTWDCITQQYNLIAGIGESI